MYGISPKGVYIVNKSNKMIGDIGPQLKELGIRPVSTSQLGTFLACRRKWYLGRNYPVPIKKPHFTVGSSVHEGLERYYNTGSRASALVSAKSYLVHNDDGMWSGEWDMVRCMVDGFIKYAKQNDEYEVIGTELEFVVILGGHTIENLHKMSVEERQNVAVIKGFIDVLARATKDLNRNGIQIKKGEFILGEYKTAKAAGNIYYPTAVQCGMYMLAASKITGEKVDKMVYNTLYKKVPKQPARLTKGGVSAAACATTYQIYEAALIEEYGSVALAPTKQQSRLKTLPQNGQGFFERDWVQRSEAELQELERRFIRVIPELNKVWNQCKAGDLDACYPNPGRDCKMMCDHQELCIQYNKGLPLKASEPLMITVDTSGQALDVSFT